MPSPHSFSLPERLADGAVVSLAPQPDVSWAESYDEGQLSVDVLTAGDELVIVATLAGTRPEDISLHLYKDLLTIRGVRQNPVPEVTEYYYQECFWGPFSRTIVLPVDVEQESAQAQYRAGILTIRLRQHAPRTSIPLMVIEE